MKMGIDIIRNIMHYFPHEVDLNSTKRMAILMLVANISELENKSLEELVSFSTDLDSLIKKKRKQETKLVRAKMNELAKAAGFESVDDFMANQGGRQPRIDKGVKLPPKYRNPKNPDETWSGKGPTPKWLKEYENGGGNKESCRIPS